MYCCTTRLQRRNIMHIPPIVVSKSRSKHMWEGAEYSVYATVTNSDNQATDSSEVSTSSSANHVPRNFSRRPSHDGFTAQDPLLINHYCDGMTIETGKKTEKMTIYGIGTVMSNGDISARKVPYPSAPRRSSPFWPTDRTLIFVIRDQIL